MILMDYRKILNMHYEEGSALLDLLLTHSECVAKKALNVVDACHLDVDREFVRQAAMLHDVGIVRCDAPSIYCFGTEPYIRHGVIGGDMMRGIGLPDVARVCERHTGSGLTAKEIAEAGLPLPHVDLVPETLEEKLICYADKFYSKSGNPREEKRSKECGGRWRNSERAPSHASTRCTRSSLPADTLLFHRGAPVGDDTLSAFRIAGCAYVAPVEYQPVVCVGENLTRDVLHEFPLRAFRVGGVVGKSYSVAYTEYVGVDRHRRLVPYHGEHYVGCLSPHSGQLHQIVDVGGHLRIELVSKHTRRFNQVARLIVGEGDAFDVLVHLFFLGLGKGAGVGIGGEKCGCHHVDTLVGALR